MSPAVRVSLMALRLYLFALVGLMVYKFVGSSPGAETVVTVLESEFFLSEILGRRVFAKTHRVGA